MPNPQTPDHPIPAVLAVVIRGDDILLVRRANPPDAGLWGFPGGKIDKGETLQTAALRELHEETGVTAKALQVFTALDAFDRDAAGMLRRHFILIAVLCEWTGGEPVAGDDALEARWVDLAGLPNSGLPLSRDVADVAAQAAALLAEGGA
ncbi:NUDIX hydrolase [Rhodobacter sp. NTK016B]|uniref:NUDIX hydrolase n=1 Tax=Rhodobacter sp. NTK016B TaxID=2759676 RepID=UPI001A8C31BE|nr:NUDIX hydrolase [Rhodobacter sp. NTK016B]MBN8292064.1 NUDIX hydrolase [Rhodobacter sp. NTK016B]